MKILVIGSGGREHAIVKKFNESALVKKIFAIPGNPGIGQLASLISLDIKNHELIVNFCIEEKITFVFIGPEDPLIDGLADSLRLANIPVVGPSKQAAQLEGSKIFAKNFMKRADVSTADALVVRSVVETLKAAESHSAPFVLKADGLAAGKGVFICKNLQELEWAAVQLFEKKIFGLAGSQALLEKNLAGVELSFIILTNGTAYQILPLAQDHKRLFNNNLGPNTGGMGTIAPLKISNDLLQKIEDRIIKPTISQLQKEDMLFNGILFIGIMVVKNEPYALEYNVRLGDPETQSLLPLIENDLAELFFNLSMGRLQKIKILNLCTFCLINAAEGYPDQPKINEFIELPDDDFISDSERSYVLQAGTKTLNGKLVSSGGRVLNIVAIAKTHQLAKKQAYALNEKIIFKNRQYRTDIGDYQFQLNES